MFPTRTPAARTVLFTLLRRWIGSFQLGSQADCFAQAQVQREL
jgi:hypothetical protein